jgi:hypothetical protein
MMINKLDTALCVHSNYLYLCHIYADPKQLRRQRDRERYAQNRDEILKRQRLSREKRKTTTGLLNDSNTVSHTPAAGQSGVTQLQKLTCDVTGCGVP